MDWNTEFFQKKKFTSDQLNDFFNSAKRDLIIAKETSIPEIMFTFGYNALLKLGILIIAKNEYKVKSRMGHHTKIIDQMSKIIDDKNIKFYGQEMRKKRNIDLYSGGSLVTTKEAVEYLEFIEELFEKINN